jgi:hypothetical protein
MEGGKDFDADSCALQSLPKRTEISGYSPVSLKAKNRVVESDFHPRPR